MITPLAAWAGGAARIDFRDQGALAQHREQIETLVNNTLDRTATVLSIGSLVVEVSADAGRTIPGWGMGGYALSPQAIEVVIDPQYGNLEAALDARLPHIVAHEAHHAVRFRSPGPYRTLLEALVFEGLADRFAEELLQEPLPPWATAFPASETEGYLERARPLFNSNFDFEAWFFGVNSDLPPWTGYTLGYRLVVEHQLLNGLPTAADLVSRPARDFQLSERSELRWYSPCLTLTTKRGARTNMECAEQFLLEEAEHHLRHRHPGMR